MSGRLRIAVIGAGAFGRNHARAIRTIPGADLAAIVDQDASKSAALGAEFGAPDVRCVQELAGRADAAIVAVSTSAHEAVATELLEAGIDVLVEKPIATTAEAGERMTRVAERCGRLLQVGHLERFNPAVTALQRNLTIPLFFEIHRLSVFTPRSLDVDVVLDLMIHDLDIVLTFTRETPMDIRAAGISVLSRKVDIANVRLAFASGCIANLTASRVSTEKVRKLRLFQPGEYVSLDYSRQDAMRIAVKPATSVGGAEVGTDQMALTKGEPLQLELEAFFQAVRTRSNPIVDGQQGTAALRLAEEILVKIGEHSELVAQTTQRHKRP